MNEGLLIDEYWSEGGGWQIFDKNDLFHLYEIPLYGGEPRYIGNYDTFKEAHKVATENLT